VTRLGEFSAFGRSYSLGRLFKFTKVARKFGSLFLPRFKVCNNFDEIGSGYISGDFFTNASSHPGGKITETIVEILIGGKNELKF
jgi:hypothetical protein